jgi:elongation factor P
MKESDNVEVTTFEGEVLGVALPVNVPFKVIEAEQAVKGDTATGAMKNAKIETGFELKVPLFIEAGQTIVVNTVDGKYSGRA